MGEGREETGRWRRGEEKLKKGSQQASFNTRREEQPSRKTGHRFHQFSGRKGKK